MGDGEVSGVGSAVALELRAGSGGALVDAVGAAQAVVPASATTAIAALRRYQDAICLMIISPIGAVVTTSVRDSMPR